tara:strand:+ start:459 stop:644 length:186 start_codon:yes stop_codon:yes gene_type:complete
VAPTAGLEPITCNLLRLLRLISATAIEIVDSKQLEQSNQAILLMAILKKNYYLPKNLGFKT